MRAPIRIASAATLLLCLLPTRPASAGRYEGLTKRHADGPKMNLAAATYFGGDGIEEFVAAGCLPDGSIAAFGNAWGPSFPSSPAPLVIGSGKHRGLATMGKDRKGNEIIRPDNPDIAGMVVFFDSRLQSTKRVVRFDWGLATIAAATVTRDGKGLILAGRCTEAFGAVASKSPINKTHPSTGGKDAGPYKYEGADCSGDVYVMRMSAAADRIEWVWVLQGHRTPPEDLWATGAGDVYFECSGITKITGNGAALTKLSARGPTGQAGLRAVNPADGTYLYGGDRNTSTGREPWRQPYLYKFGPSGQKVWKLWEWSSRGLRDGQGNDDGLVSDSSPRCGDYYPNGDFVISGWSDGGNSVFGRQPNDVSKPVGIKSGLGMDCSGMKNANSLSWIMRIDGRTQQVTAFTMWLAYIPDNFEEARVRGAPNFTSTRTLRILPNEAVAIAGSCATGLVQTPNSFYRAPTDGRKFGGRFVAVFSKDMTSLLFSSLMPGCDEVAIAPAPNGLVVVSRCRGDDPNGNKMPALNAVQAQKKGPCDAHIALLTLP